MDQDVKSDWDWSNQYEKQAKDILLLNISGLVDIETASIDKDLSQSTDIIFTVKDGDIAVRIRRDDCEYRDLTVRSERTSGAETELTKIKNGFARWYLYGWTNNTNQVNEWMIVDLDKVRTQDLLSNRKPIPNTDGKTKFVAISFQQLRKYNCLVAYKIEGENLHPPEIGPQLKIELPPIVQEQINDKEQEIKRLKTIIHNHEKRKSELVQAVCDELKRDELESEIRQLRQQIQYLVAMVGQVFSPNSNQGAFLNISGINPVQNNGTYKGKEDD